LGWVGGMEQEQEQEQEHGTGADEPQQESAAKTTDATPSSPLRDSALPRDDWQRRRCPRCERSTCSPAV